MPYELIFNELSIQGAPNDITARERMYRFVKTAQEACKSGASRILRSHLNLYGIVLSDDYPISRWVNDRGNVDIDVIRYFQSITTKVPVIDEEKEPKLYNRILETECKYNGEVAMGLGAAALLPGLALSFNTDQCWQEPTLTIQIDELVGGGQINSSDWSVKNSSAPAHIATHSEWLRNGILSETYSGTELWNSRQLIFPNLDFCEAVEPQLRNIADSNPVLRQIMRKLNEMESYASKRQGGHFDPVRNISNVTSESEATMNTYGEQRTFLCSDNQRRAFTLHTRLTPEAWRIYFGPVGESAKIYVAYIGPHLPTVKYKAN